MGCAFLSPSLSSYRFNFFDHQKSERPWEPITNAVVVSEYGHLWHKKIHGTNTNWSRQSQRSPMLSLLLVHSNVDKHLLVQRNLSCISKSSCERFGKVWHCEFCLWCQTLSHHHFCTTGIGRSNSIRILIPLTKML